MFPTHVGMNRGGNAGAATGLNVPHTRGDEPERAWKVLFAPIHVPHTRGDEPAGEQDKRFFTGMFPTHVGMNRCKSRSQVQQSNVPHTRGDEPRQHQQRKRNLKCSPHTWG